MASCLDQDFNFEAADAYFGVERCLHITTIENAADVLADTYFELNGFRLAETDSEDYFVEELGYIYFGTDPALTGKTGLEAVINTGDSANEVALAIKTAIDGDADFSARFTATVNGDVLQIRNKHIGSITEEADGGTGFSFVTDLEGKGPFLGKTEDAIEVTFDTTAEAVTTNQTGSQTLDEILTGVNAEATMSLVELPAERFDTVFASVVGDKVIVNNKNIIGGGESKLFKSLKVLGGRLILHPRRLANNDRSRDFSFHKSAPKPGSYTFDGTALQSLELTFTAYLDDDIDRKANLYTVNEDWSELL
jgi:hypothetical protein